MLARVVEAKYRGGHCVWLRFSDDVSGEVDLASEMWGDVFEPLRDPRAFAAFRLDGTLTWDNGADLAPEFLHDLVVKSSARRDASVTRAK